MDPKRFQESKTGSLVAMPDDDWAFVPHPLPPKWRWPNRLSSLLVEARTALGTLNGIGRYLPNPNLLLRPLQRREALRSSSLEGTYASPEEILLFELRPHKPKSKMDRANAWMEVNSYSDALREGHNYLQSGRVFSLSLVRLLHKWLLQFVRGADKSPGDFRACQVWIGSDRRFGPPPVVSLPPCLEAFEQQLEHRDKTFDPLVQCYLLHYQFETIHPFVDGNGRVGRLLLALMTYRWCNLSQPWLYMSAFFERHKDEYIDKLFDVSVKGAWEPWIEFCLRGTIAQSEDAMARCDRLLTLKDDMHARVSGGAHRLHPMIDDLFVDPFVRITQLAEKHDVYYQTAKSDVARLVKAKILTELKNVKPKTFCAQEIFRVAYSETVN